MNPNAYALVGLTAIVAALAATLTFAILRIFSAARTAGRGLQENSGAETAMLTAALQDAMAKLKAQERATALRAEASERLSEDIIASLTAGLLVVSDAGVVRIVNPAGRRMLGLDDRVEAGVSYRQLLASSRPLANLLDECLHTGRPISRRSIEMADNVGLKGPRHLDGRASHLGVTVSPMIDAGKQVHGAICLFTDLTAVVALEEQLRLKDSLARVGELTAGIAHEFRNGLATIHGYSRLIDLDAIPQEFRPYVEGIRAETEAMREVVTNFLNFARPTQLSVGPVDLRAIAERAADDLRADAEGLGGDIVVSGEFATVDGDDVLLRQAFSNLLRNAVEACGAASVAPVVRIDSIVDLDRRACIITVSDNGPGIPDDARERIFHPFFTTKPQGTGLGLALVQKIIVTHNGRVDATAGAPGGGGRLRIVLPVQAVPQA